MKGSICLLAFMLGLPLGLASEEGRPLLRFEPLPYAFEALEPHIDARTMEIHYSRHHKGYFDKLVKAVEGTSLAQKTLVQILRELGKWPASVRNNAGGHWNHTFFWKLLSPKGGGQPQGRLSEMINTHFGSFEGFKEAFKKEALGRFGSGWAWLALDGEGRLFLTSTPNQDNPLMDVAEQPGFPLLGIDLWEHAYYLKYQNRRAAYVEAFWHLVDWRRVEALLTHGEGL